MNWFVGGDYEKILKLQRKINSKSKSKSFYGKTTSYSSGISGGNGLIPIGVSTSISGNKSVIEFNPVELLKEILHIK